MAPFRHLFHPKVVNGEEGGAMPSKKKRSQGKARKTAEHSVGDGALMCRCSG